MQEITYKELHRQLHYDLKTGIFTRLVSNAKCVKIGDIAGTMCHYYINIKINNVSYGAHRLAWLYVYGYFPEHGIDHRDQIKHHNWIDNLREASKQCNARNSGNPKNNISGIKGVRWHNRDKKWVSYITVNNKTKHLGYYKSFDNAVCARLAAEQCLDWSSCDSSSPAHKYVMNMKSDI